ncbi:MAG: hypothetical protein EOO75_02585 [Myxococcales bacterium]|nr:MAG: hypothetical protein EOO75_02585 [Myxococcales bacterium]
MQRAARWLAFGVLLVSGCHKQRPEKVPGETDLEIESVQLRADDSSRLHLETAPLLNKLGLRRGGPIYTHRYYNPFRLAEDRRRIQSYWQTGGYYDAQVAEPEVTIGKRVAVRWVVHEGPRYELLSVDVRHAPPGFAGTLRAMAPSNPGQVYDLEAMRVARYDMAAVLQRAGYGHARVYSRAFVDRAARRFHWVYLVDAGPLTRVRSVRIEGLHRLSPEVVTRRAGFAPGDPFSLDREERAEFDLLDLGSFASANVDSGADVEQYVGDVPDSGGVLTDDQIDEQGNLRPRPLSADLDLVIRVVEAPRTQVKLRAGVEADPTRADATAGGELWRRDLGDGPHHLTVEGRLGYGHFWDDNDRVGRPSGLYGEALVRTTHPGLLGRVVDGRLTARYRDTLFPDFHLRELTAGPGLRSTLARGLFLDLDALFRRGQQVGLGAFDLATRSSLELPADDVSLGLQVDASIVHDRRNDPAEPTTGHLLALRSSLSPGGPLGTHRYLRVEPEARAFVPLNAAFSLGARASAGWAFLGTDDGIPQGARLFGGGAYGFRGVGRDRLSPTAERCVERDGATVCDRALVGGLSLTEASLELRYLPPLQQAGLVVFADLGGSTATANPFGDGLSAAVGFGPRIRLWYLPISIDYAYGFLARGDTASPRDGSRLFLRIGEAF